MPARFKFRPSWLWTLIAILIIVGVGRLRFDVEILNLLPPELGVAQGLKLYQQNFSDARELIVALSAPTEDDAIDSARALATLLRRHSNLVSSVTWQPAWLENPAQATELVAYLWLNQEPELFAQMTNRVAAANRTNVLQQAREELATSFSPNQLAQRAYDPYGLMELPPSVSAAAPAMGSGDDMFSSTDGRFRLLFVEALPDLTSYRACRTWLRQVRAIIAEARAQGELSGEVELHFTGRPVYVTEIAGGMEGDMGGSAGGTLITIGILFWLTHRRLRPLFWLLFMLITILAATTAMGGLILGTVNVVSMGFASILLGLAEDFGIVIYQEARSHPELDAGGLRRAVSPGIFWSAVTTAAAFLTLNLSALPGLAELGSLVGLGIIIAALGMIYVYLPLVLRWRRPQDLAPAAERRERFLLFTPTRLLPRKVVWIITALVGVVSIAVLFWQGGPKFDRSPDVLKPRNSEANATLELIKSRFGRSQDPVWVLIPGKNEEQVSERLARVGQLLDDAQARGLIRGHTLPNALWPRRANQTTNRAALPGVLAGQAELQAAAVAAGFTAESFYVTEHLFNTWRRALETDEIFWPSNDASRWVLGKVVARPSEGFLALGMVQPTTNQWATRRLVGSWPTALADEGILLSGWELLGSTAFELVVRELPRVLVPIFLLVLLSLALAFRRVKEVVLSLATLAFGAICLGAAMNLLGWHWNLLNVMSLSLLLGMGIDYSIHMQLALRRYDGDLMAVRHSVGRALLLAGSTTVVGFASLAFSTNTGMASLGKVCALGITLALLVSVYFLPEWWCLGQRQFSSANSKCPTPK